MSNEKGSVILETALVFPIVLLVMLAFSVLVRYFAVYETIQHGMYETTREMSAYYYLYAVTGLEETSNAIAQETKKAEDNLNMLAEPFTQTIGSIRTIANQLSSAQQTLGKASTGELTLADAQQVEQQVSAIVSTAGALGTSIQDCGAAVELILQSPLEAMTYLLKFGAGQGFEWAQNSVMNLIGQALLSQHIPGRKLQRYAAASCISYMHAAMAWNGGGSGDVEMVATYKFTIRLFGGYDFWVTQRTTAKGWGMGV